MTDEKNTSPEQDDWLADFDEMPEEAADELDQASIDALLGGSGQSGVEPQAAAEPHEADQGLGEIDQSALDALLNGDDDEPSADPGQQADSSGDDLVDQASLDALLNGGGDAEAAGSQEAAPPKAEQATGQEDLVDQASLDALLNGPEELPAAAEEAQAAPAAADNSLDSFLEGLDDEAFQAALEDDSGVPKQEDIDELFSQAQQTSGTEATAAPEEVDFSELLGEATNTIGTFGQEETSGDGQPELAAQTQGATLDDSVFDQPTISEGIAVPGEDGNPAGTRRGFLPPHLLSSGTARKYTAGIGAGLVLLIGVGLWLGLRGPAPAENQAEIIMAAPPEVSPEAPAMDSPAIASVQPQILPEQVNHPPRVAGGEYKMGEKGGEVPLLLLGQDDDADPLQFEITEPPAHGRLSGELPAPVYLPDNNFPGEDRFAFRAIDGQAASEVATVVISGPAMSPPEPESPPQPLATIKPKRSVPAAADVTLKARSTEEIAIDWPQIWRRANATPFDPKQVSVEAEKEGLHGKLTQVSPTRYRYQPERFFSGQEVIRYRFKTAGLASKPGELHLQIELGDHPPQVRLQPLAKEIYRVGDTVVLDASATKDETPGQLSFKWQQLAGPPVILHSKDEQGAVVSFVVPSSFYVAENPGPVLRLTAVDPAGQQASRDISISTESRHHSALWQGTRDHKSAVGLLPTAEQHSALRRTN